MKRIISIGILVTGLAFMVPSCNWFDDVEREANFEDMEGVSIYNFILENDSLYGKFRQILDTTGVGKIISAYNPYNTGYTLFLPTDKAIDNYIEASNYNSFNDLLADTDYALAMARFHVVNMSIDANDFPFGALPARTLSEDLLTVSFVIEEINGSDSSYYNINNQAPVSIPNNELSNGFIHVISQVLSPITFTSKNWLMESEGFSIFQEAVTLTGFEEILDRNLKTDSSVTGVTLLIEPDSVFNRKGIYNVQDLLDSLEVTETNYTESINGLYQFVGYHILDESAFLDDFLDEATNYTTFSNLPVNINGVGIDIEINREKQIYDTLIVGTDTTYIDFVGVFYDESNVITQSGAIHFITQVMFLQSASRSTVRFEFYDEPLFNEFRQEVGEYLVEDPDALRNISWEGPDLLFIEEPSNSQTGWGDDYLRIVGDFSIKYKLPKIVQGTYEVHIRAHAFSSLNALVELFIDGKKLGGLVDLSEGGSANWPFNDFHVGDIDFNTYEFHEVEIRSLIPGKFDWDWVMFEPVTD